MKKVTIIAAAVSLVANSLFIWAEHRALSANGTGFELWLSAVLVFPFLLAVITAIVGVVLLPVSRNRRQRLKMIAATAIYALVAFACLQVAVKVRTHAFAALAERSVPVIAAIEQFEAEHGTPPVTLEELVPNYLSVIPPTGMGAFPEFGYVSGEKAQSAYGDRWALYVLPPVVGIGFDEFWYVPSMHYPMRSDGAVERIGDWAYLHE